MSIADARCLLKQSEVAAVLGVSPRSVEGWRVSGRGPRFVRLSSRAIRYRPEDVDAWIAGRLRSSTSDGETNDIRKRGCQE